LPATIAAKIHQTLDVHGDFATKVAFHDVIAVDGLANLENFGVGELGNAALCRDAHLLANLFGLLGLRHRRQLPVRGQRTHTNARTRKGKAKAIAGKKK